MRTPNCQILAAFLVLASIGGGEPPAWWSEGEPPVIDISATANNRGPASVGQAKWMVTEALRALTSKVPSVANQIRSDLAGSLPDHADRIIDLTVPEPKDTVWLEKQKAPLLIGQLKAIAAPFYTRLNAQNPTWLASERAANGTNHPNSIFPWSTDITDDANKAIASIGQLKAVFSLRFDTLFIDEDLDGMADIWEIQNFSNLAQLAGGDPDNDGLVNLQEFTMGSNPLAIGADVDADGLPDDWAQAYAGKFAAYPPLLSAALFKKESATVPVLLRNDTTAPVNYNISLSGNTRPGYSYKDSLAGAVLFAWEDIAIPDNLLSAVSEADDAVESVALGFDFPFSGTSYTSMQVSSNGLITFTNVGAPRPYYGQVLPDPWAPGQMIAPLWSDLNPSAGGDIFCKTYDDRVVVQYEKVVPFASNGSYTFQVVLFSNGNIKFLYKAGSDDGSTELCVAGIQDATANMGIHIPVGSLFAGTDVAVLISPESEFFSLAPLAGVVAPHTVVSVPGLFRSRDLPTALYEARVSVVTDMPDSTPQHITARLQVKWDGHYADVALISPATGHSVLQGKPVEFSATASDFDGIANVGIFAGAVKIGDAVSQSGAVFTSTVIPSLPAGSHRIFARATTTPGITTDSASITLVIIADSDLDGLPDQWELDNGFSPNDPSDAEADADGDGLTNFEEFMAGSNPNFPRIHAFAEEYNSDGTITYTWISHASLGDWFRIEDARPDGTTRIIFATTYGSDKLPYVPGVTSYSITLNPATDYLP